jgi:hypothetical protein
MIALCEAGCKRPATKGSGGRWCYWDDPAVETSTKLQARQLGGRRGQLTPTETARLFDELEPGSPASRTAFRVRLMELLAVGKIPSSKYRDFMLALDGMAKDQLKSATPSRGPLVVEVHGMNGKTAATP